MNERIVAAEDAAWFDVQERNARATVKANPGTRLAEVESMKAERYARAAAAIRAGARLC
jgi:hypothetical protein